VTFIPQPTKFKPIKPVFWDRQFGSQFNEWEFQLLKEFNRAKNTENPIVTGTVFFDRRFGGSRFLLFPAQYLIQDYVICECPPGLPVPSNWSYVTVAGKKKVIRNHWEMLVDDISYSEMKIPVEPEITFKDFQDELFLQWAGLDSPLRELFAFEFISSPPFPTFNQAGGINLTLYDETTTGESKKLLKHFKNMIPLDIALGKSGRLSIPQLFPRLTLPPFSWSFKYGDADKPLNQYMMNFLKNRRSARLSEISVGLGSKRNQPKSIYEPILTMVDQPTLLPNNVEMRSMNLDPSPEITKYIVTMQTLFPKIGETQKDFEKTLDDASQRIVNLAKKYDLPQSVQKHGLFDPSFYGKPQSILRLAMASARAQEKKSIDEKWVMKVFDEYYLKNMESVMEVWQDIVTPKGIEMLSLKEELDRQLLKFITEKESADYGVGFHLIEGHFVYRDEFELGASLRRLLALGKIREVTLGVYRSVPFE
jgi:hypothetical protein